MKVIKSLENRGGLLKGTTEKDAIQERGFLNFLKPLMTAGLPLMKNILKSIVASVLIPLGLIAAASVTDAAIQKDIFGSGTTTLKISNKEIKDILNIAKSFEESNLLIEGISETIKLKQKNKKADFSQCY